MGNGGLGGSGNRGVGESGDQGIGGLLIEGSMD